MIIVLHEIPLVKDLSWISVFFRGKYKLKTEDGPLITSKDGFNAYLLIMDVYSRYMWVFPTTGKSPQLIS